ncbi:DUF6541 family protein [Amycolatopsis australiensis]|uniref:Uncharacterized protein n=1 Tax=Amycolatopsis australiensis TaxID=546364 RepID=A0A1K1QEE4_9PSEU|nr:DUF6541 family protein [Amycolatopsis australiensis]SFW58076.1 hypothetical protein SAMN04489730_1680 [Amycolatopsis australiensis]
MLTEGLRLLVGVLVVFVPGTAVLLAFGVRERLWLAGLSAPLTTGFVLLVSLVTGSTGLRYGLLSVTVSLVVVVAAAVLVRFLLRRRRVVVQPAEDPDLRAVAGRTGTWVQLAGLAIGVVGVLLGVRTWHTGLGSWRTPTQEHDTVTHAVLTAFTHFTGQAAPWQVLPVDVVHDTAVQFYPPGFTNLAALLTDVFGDTMLALNLVTVVFSVVVLPLSAAALTAAVLRHARLGRGWVELGAGVAALVAVQLYRPGIAFAHDGGVLPNAAAMALAPGLTAVTLVIGRRHWGRAVLVGIALAGSINVHPSALTTAALTTVAAMVGLLFTRRGRTAFVGALLPLVLAGVVTVVAALPDVFALLRLSGGTVVDAPATIPPQSLGTAVGVVVRLPYSGYFDLTGTMGQVVLGVLGLVGAVVAIVSRRCWPLVTAWAFWVAVIVSFHVSPNTGFGAAVARYYYRAAGRVDTHIYLMIPVLAGALFALVGLALAAQRLRIPVPLRTRPVFAAALAVVVLAALTVTTFRGYMNTGARSLSQRYATPEFVRYDASDDAAAAWLHEHVAPGETILNNANDGSTLLYVDYDLPILNIVPDGHSPITDNVTLLAMFNSFPENPAVQDILRRKNVKWVYADSQAPTVGTDGNHWTGQRSFSLAPGLERLNGLPGLTKVFSRGTVSVYHLDLPPRNPPQG